VFGIGVGVVGRPRVVHRDTGEPVEDAGVVDTGAAALGVAGEQGVFAGAGAMHPVQRAGDPEPGLVEPGHLGRGNAIGDTVEEAVQSVGGPPGHLRHRRLRHRRAEQLGQRLRGALPRQELPGIQVHSGRGDLGPVLHRRTHTIWRDTAGRRPAHATARDHLMLGHPHRHRRQVEHLPLLHAGFRGTGKPLTATNTRPGLVPNPLVRVGNPFQRRPRMPTLPARPASALATQRLRRRLDERRIRRRRLRRVPRVLPQLALKLNNPSLQRFDHHPQLRDGRPQHRVLRGKVIIGPATIVRHHTIINNSLPTSTNHADDLTSYKKIRPVMARIMLLYWVRLFWSDVRRLLEWSR
jgi:hypothetical protein